MPDSFGCEGTLTIEQESDGVGEAAGSVTFDGSDLGRAQGTLTIDRTRFLAFSGGFAGSGVYAQKVRRVGITLLIDGVDFSESVDGTVEIAETLEDYIAVRTARFSLCDDRLAYSHASSISTEEKYVSIDVHFGPPGYEQAWRAFEGWMRPQTNDEPFRPAATYQARSWMADLLAAQVCLDLPALAGYTRADILILLAESAGRPLEIVGGPGARVKKPVALNGVTWAAKANTYGEIEGWIIREAGGNRVELVPENEYLAAALSADVARLPISEGDGTSCIPLSETPPDPEVTEWTISGEQLGGAGDLFDYTIGTTANGVHVSIRWQYDQGAGGIETSSFSQRVTKSAVASNVLVHRETTVRKFEAISSTEPFILGPQQNGVLAQPTRMYFESVAHEGFRADGTFGPISRIDTTNDFTDSCIPYRQVITYGFDSLGVYGQLSEDRVGVHGTVETLREGYTLVTYRSLTGGAGAFRTSWPPGAASSFVCDEITREYFSVDPNGGWQKATIKIVDYGDEPRSTVTYDNGEGEIPLPFSAEAETSVYSTQVFMRTVGIEGARFKPAPDFEMIPDLETPEEGDAVAWRRSRRGLSRQYLNDGMIVPGIGVGDTASVANHARAMDSAVGGYVTMMTIEIDPITPNVSCKREIEVPPAYMLGPR